MRGSILATLVLSASVFYATGCATIPGPSSQEKQTESKAKADSVKDLFGFLRDVVSSVLPTKENELKRLVDGGSYIAAADYWVANQDVLAKSSAARSLIQSISTGIGKLYGSEAATFVAALQPFNVAKSGSADSVASELNSRQRLSASESPHWSLNSGEWPNLKARITASEQLVKRVREHPFFVANPTSLPPSIQSLDETLVATRATMQEQAARAFVSYDHSSVVSFFDAFPVQLNPRMQSALAVRGSALWLRALLGGTEDQARAVVKVYAGHIRAPEARLMIASAYTSVVARERKWGGQRSLNQILQLIQALDDVGLDSSLASRSVKIGVLRGLNSQADGFRWAISNQPAAAIEAHDLPIGTLNEWVREVATVKPSQIYVLIDPARTSALWQLTSLHPRVGERQIGQHTNRNPEWDRARQAVEEARREYAEAETADQQTQLQAQQLAAQSAGSSMGLLSAVLGSSASSMGVSAARRRMSQAESTFASTPHSITSPVTQTYKSALASFDGVRERETAIYVVHGKSGQFYKLKMINTVKISDQIVFAIDPSDSGFAAVAARNRTAQERFRQLASNAPYHSPDEVWEKLTSAAETPTTPISRLVQTVRDDHARWFEAAASQLKRAQSSTQQLEEQVLKMVEAPK